MFISLPCSKCTATCDSGYEFPGKMLTDIRECDQMFGDWFEPPGRDIPDCVRKCPEVFNDYTFNCFNGNFCCFGNKIYTKNRNHKVCVNIKKSEQLSTNV